MKDLPDNWWKDSDGDYFAGLRDISVNSERAVISPRSEFSAGGDTSMLRSSIERPLDLSLVANWARQTGLYIAVVRPAVPPTSLWTVVGECSTLEAALAAALLASP